MKNWYPEIVSYCKALDGEFDLISEGRKESLEQIGQYIRSKTNNGESTKLIVICTHNSRRSHFGQIWLKIAAEYYGLIIETFSGGTEATAFHPNAVKAVGKCGFQVTSTGDKSNPVYSISFTDDIAPIKCHSKKFDDPANPVSGFGAIMVCTSAAEACPLVPGADERFVLPYSDPKEFDGTELEEEKYSERCRQIGREMFYIVSSL